jgi:hypothetical protein
MTPPHRSAPNAAASLAALALLGLLAILAPALASADSDQRVWVASGKPGGTYRDVYARAVEQALGDHLVLHRTTSGSGENLDLLANGRVDLAFVQADIYAAGLKRAPDRYGDLLIVGRVADECVYIAHRSDGPVREPKQLEKPVDGRPAEIAVGPLKGGMSGTWAYLTTLEPELANAKVHHVGGPVAIDRLVAGTFDAVAWVTDPTNLGHHMLRALRANEKLALMDLRDADLTGTLPDGTRVYEARSVPIEPGPQARQIQTVCTSALLLARPETDPQVVTGAARAFGLREKKPATQP